jgi:hypothetical protein
MTRNELVRRLAESTTRPVADLASSDASGGLAGASELFVWFEDTSMRRRLGRRGIAGLPESLLPHARGSKVVDRRFTEGHLHLLSAVRIRTDGGVSDAVAAIYTAALSVGTLAWIGCGANYEAAWEEMFPYAAPELRTPRVFGQR